MKSLIIFVILGVILFWAFSFFWRRIPVAVRSRLKKYWSIFKKMLRRRAPVWVLLGIFLLVWAFWPTDNYQNISQNRNQNISQNRNTLRNMPADVPLNPAGPREQTIKIWQSQGFQVVETYLLNKGDTSDVVSCRQGQDLRVVGETGKQLILKKMGSRAVTLDPEDQLDMGGQPMSMVAIGAEDSPTKVTFLKRYH